MWTDKRKTWIIAILLLATLCLPGCTAQVRLRDASIISYGDPLVKTELLFGLSKPDGTVVTQAEWQDFVDSHVTPRFKEGFTVMDAAGQWMLHSGSVIREKSKVVMILHKGNQETDRLIEEIRREYKVRFEQESVLRITSSTSVSF